MKIPMIYGVYSINSTINVRRVNGKILMIKLKTKLLILLIGLIAITLLIKAISFDENQIEKGGLSSEQIKTQDIREDIIENSKEAPIKATNTFPENTIHAQIEDLAPALSIDKLLDENDRTDKNRLIIQNHTNLLEVIKEMMERRRGKAVTVQQLSRWVQVLINDAYLKNELDRRNVPQIDLLEDQMLRPELIPIDDIASRHVSLNYLIILRSLVDQLSNVNADDSSLVALTGQVIDLARRRKKLSEGFYLTLMHKYFPSEEYAVVQKIAFTQQFVDAGDMKLAKYALEYFQDLLDSPESKKQKTEIQQLINNIKNELNKHG